MSKFSRGDLVRVTDIESSRYDQTLTVSGIWSSGLKWVYNFVVDGHAFSMHERDLTLADPDVHTVLDEMDAESAPKDPELYSGPVSATVYPTDQHPWAQKRKQILDAADAPCMTAEQWETAIEADPVSAPSHYRSHPSGIETIQITRHESFLRGNVLKYVLRAPYKGSEIEDLKKAAQYLQWEIDRAEATQ